MERFCVDVIAATPNPQQVVWAAMHQDYSEHYVWDSQEQWPSEQRAGELIVKHLLSGDRGHYGPLEHPQITFNVGYFPHSMMQQIRTHRVGVSFDVQCLTGDTEVTFVEASGSLRKIKIAELYGLWANTEQAVRTRKIRGRNGEGASHFCKNTWRLEIAATQSKSAAGALVRTDWGSACGGRLCLWGSPDFQSVGDLQDWDAPNGEPPGNYRRDFKSRLKKMNLRVLNEDTGIFEVGHIQEVFDQGIQPIYRLTLEDGKTLNCTENHRLLTSQGWQMMREAVELKTDANQEVISYKQDCYLMANGVVVGEGLYRDKSWLQKQLLAGLTARQMARKTERLVEKAQHLKAHPVKVVQVHYIGRQNTYDIEVSGQWHNFVANGVVVHNSFRYTGQRIVDVALGSNPVEDVFYLRPVGNYTNRQGKRYFYSEEQRSEDLKWLWQACQHYKKRIDEGLSEEHARGLIPFDARQHFVLSCNLRSLLHLLDLRWKKDAQLEAQKFCELLYIHLENWCPAVAQWYKENRAKKAKLSP